MAGALTIRRAGSADVPALLSLGSEHAVFEHLSHGASQRPDALAQALESESPRLYAWLVEVDGVTAGYASATIDFSTLDGALYLHMDCLYVRDGWRNRVIGRHLWDAVHAFANTLGCAAIQWQTPSWNTEAARFYRRLGARESPKLRYNLPLGDG